MTIRLDEILENLNGFGRYQKLRFFLLCLSGLLPPIASYMHSFIAARPRFICASNIYANETFETDRVILKSEVYKERCFVDPMSHVSMISQQTVEALYRRDTARQEQQLNQTNLDSIFDILGDNFDLSSHNHEFTSNGFFDDISIDSNNSYTGLNRCSVFRFDRAFYQTTLTEEWNLVCNRAVWRSFMQTIYFSGMLIGSILLGIIANRLGQKVSLIISFVSLVIGSLLLSFGPQSTFPTELNYILLVAGRFLIAIGSHGISINGYIITMETVGKSRRVYCALMFEFIFSLGQLVLCFAAYFLRTWRYLTLVTFIPLIPFFIFVCFANESLHFLLKRKKYDQVHKILQSIAKCNKTKMDENAWRSFLTKEHEGRHERRISSTTSTTLRPRFIFVALIALNWVLNNFVFHGLGLRANDLGIYPYITFSLSAILELVCCVFTFKLLQYKFRRSPYFILILITGTCCTCVYLTSHIYLTIVCALIAKFSISTAYAIIRLYSSEIFPEFDRKSKVTRCSILARLGSVTAPLLVSIGDYYDRQLPFLIFGIFCFTSALTTLALPHVKKEKTRQTQQNEENNQFLQNNWLDGQEIYMDKEDEEEDDEDEEARPPESMELTSRRQSKH